MIHVLEFQLDTSLFGISKASSGVPSSSMTLSVMEKLIPLAYGWS